MPIKLQLKGQRFNNLLVLEEANKHKGGGVRWKCLCNCGMVVVRSGVVLKSKSFNSCGCHRKDQYNIIGNRYGRIVIVSFVYIIKKHSYYNCKCDCGTEKIIRGDGLKSGLVLSCGCYHQEIVSKLKYNLTGRRFGRLIVQGEGNPREHGKGRRWRCLCDCGGLTTTTTALLVKKDGTKSCGCLRDDKIREQGFKNKGSGKGLTDESILVRRRVAYKEWRQIVFERDDYTCAKCGQRGKAINAHHIISFVVNKDLRLDLDNGITLCEKCHREFHSLYGKKQYDNKTLNKFLN